MKNILKNLKSKLPFFGKKETTPEGILNLRVLNKTSMELTSSKNHLLKAHVAKTWEYGEKWKFEFSNKGFTVKEIPINFYIHSLFDVKGDIYLLRDLIGSYSETFEEQYKRWKISSQRNMNISDDMKEDIFFNVYSRMKTVAPDDLVENDFYQKMRESHFMTFCCTGVGKTTYISKLFEEIKSEHLQVLEKINMK